MTHCQSQDILLQDGTAPSIIGFSVPFANLGAVDSWGWELSLKWNDKFGDDFRYWANLNLSQNQNEVIDRKEAPQATSTSIRRDTASGAVAICVLALLRRTDAGPV